MQRREAIKKVTVQECKSYVLESFQSLYPNCTVIQSYPGFSVRPPLPYIVLEFGSEETTAEIESMVDGILYQSWSETIPFTVELVTQSRTEHDNGVKKVLPPVAADDLAESVRFFLSPLAEDFMRAKNVRIYSTSSPMQVFNVTPGVERAQCSFAVDFILRTSEYAALAMADGSYPYDRKSAASKDLAAMPAGYFDEAEITCIDEDHQGSENE